MTKYTSNSEENMIRVLQVVNIMDRAGLETMLMNYYRNIDKSQIQFDFLTHRSEEGAFDREIEALGGKVYHAPRLYPQNYMKYFKYMNEFFKEHLEYSIVHSHIDTMSAFPLLAAKRAKIPIRIAHSHNTRLEKDFKILIKVFAKKIVPLVSNVYCACGEQAGKFMYGKKKKFKIVYNAIDLKKYAFNENIRFEMKKELGIDNCFVVGHVGRYCNPKNQDYLLSVFKSLISNNIDINARLFLVGKGEIEESLRLKAKKLEIADKVLFLVDRPDVNRLYQAMDVFVLPSLFEGLPVVGIEAQANGLACIVSNQISSEILLTKNIFMLSIKANPEEWSERIMEIITKRDKTVYKTLTNNGYNIINEAEKLLKWYKKLNKAINSNKGVENK